MATTRNTTEEVIRLIAEASGDKEIGVLASSLVELSKGSGAAAVKAQALLGELQKLSDASNNVKQFVSLKAAIAETGTALEAAKTKMAGLGSQLDQTEKPSKALQASLAKAATEVQNLTRQQNLQQAELGRTGNALRAAGIDTDHLGKASQELQAKFGKFAATAEGTASALAKTGEKSKGAAEGVLTLGKVSTDTIDRLKGIAIKLGEVAIAAETLHKAFEVGSEFFGSAVEDAGALEEAFAQAGAVTGATTEQMNGLKEAAENAAKTTKFSALEAAQALTLLGRAGGNASDAVSQLPATLNLAQAAGIGVSDAASLMVQTLAEFQLGADQAAKVADLLAQGAKSGGIGIAGLGDELAKTAPLARQMGLDATQTVAVLSAMAEQGFRGKLAASTLRQALSELADPTSAFSEKLADLGIRTRDFNEVIVQLAAKGHDGEKALLALSANARPAIAALVSDGGAKLKSLATDLDGAGGAAEQAAKRMDETLKGSFNAVGKSFEELKVALVSPILEPLSNELRELAEQIDTFAHSPDFAEIRDSLREMFVDAAKAANTLFHEIDFHALSASIKSFVSSGGKDLKTITDNIREISTAVVAVGHTFQLIFDAVEAVIFGLAAAVTKLISLVTHAADAMTAPQRKVLEFFGVLDKGNDTLGNFADGAGTVADIFRDHFATSMQDAADAAGALADAASSTGTKAAVGLGQAADAADAVAASTEGVADASNDAAAGLDAAATAADGVAASQKTATEAAAELDAALHRLGITMQADLRGKADAAAKDFALLVEQFHNGSLAIEDVRAGFGKFADAQRAAVANSDQWKKDAVENQLAVQASVFGVSDSLQKMGSAGAGAGEAVAGGARVAARALRDTADAADDASSSVESFGIHSRASGNSAAASGEQYHDASFGLIAMSDEARNALQSIQHLIGTQDIWRNNFNAIIGKVKDQKAALTSLNETLDQQAAKLDPLANRLAELKLQYNFVDDATLRAYAEKEQQIKERTDRAQQEKEQALREAQDANEKAATASTRAEPASAVAKTNTPLSSSPAPSTTTVAAGGVLATLRLIVDNVPFDLRVDANSAQGLLEQLARSKAVTQRRPF